MVPGQVKPNQPDTHQISLGPASAGQVLAATAVGMSLSPKLQCTKVCLEVWNRWVLLHMSRFIFLYVFDLFKYFWARDGPGPQVAGPVLAPGLGPN